MTRHHQTIVTTQQELPSENSKTVHLVACGLEVARRIVNRAAEAGANRQQPADEAGHQILARSRCHDGVVCTCTVGNIRGLVGLHACRACRKACMRSSISLLQPDILCHVAAGPANLRLQGTAESCAMHRAASSVAYEPETAGPWSAHSMTHISMKRVAYFGSCRLNLGADSCQSRQQQSKYDVEHPTHLACMPDLAVKKCCHVVGSGEQQLETSISSTSMRFKQGITIAG